MENNNSKIGYVNFTITGEYYENLIKDSLSSGEFKVVEQLCFDANLPNDLIKKVFLLQFSMSGSSADKEGINIKFFDESPEDIADTIMTGIRSAMGSDFIKRYGLLELWGNTRSLDSHENKEQFGVFKKYFTAKEFSQLFRAEVLAHYGYKEYKNLSEGSMFMESDERWEGVNGVVTETGSFIRCQSQDHKELFPVLYMMGITDTPDAYRGNKDNDKTVHISSSSISCGAYSYAIEMGSGEDEQIPDAIYKSIWDCDVVTRFYMGFNKYPVHAQLFTSYVDKHQGGTKYGNLMFLKNVASDLFNESIKLVNFSKNIEDITTDQVFVRTSPEKSMAGILNSRLSTKSDVESAVSEIVEEFEEFKNVVKGNKLHYFFQDYLEGKNGVANMNYQNVGENKILDPEKKHRGVDFRAMVSKNQGDVVAGKISTEVLEYDLSRKLESFMKKIVKKVQSKIQVEFVTNEDETELTIVQIRIFKEVKELKDRIGGHTEEVVMIGRTFNQPYDYDHNYRTEVKIEDILIVDSEADSRELIGKKALIVREDVDFSHVLALSVTMGIPSIFAVHVDKENLQEFKTVIFDMKYREGVVYGNRK